MFGLSQCCDEMGSPAADRQQATVEKPQKTYPASKIYLRADFVLLSVTDPARDHRRVARRPAPAEGPVQAPPASASFVGRCALVFFNSVLNKTRHWRTYTGTAVTKSSNRST